MKKLLIRLGLAASVTGLTAVAYTNASAQALDAESASYLDQWQDMQQAYDAANTTPGFRTRLRGNKVESFVAYAQALQTGMPKVTAAVILAEKFSLRFGEGRKADTYGRDLMGNRLYTEIRRENSLKAASFLVKKIHSRHQHLITDIEYSRRTAIKKARAAFNNIENASAAHITKHHHVGARIINAALKVNPEDAQLKQLLIDGNAQKRAREYALTVIKKDKLLADAKEKLNSLHKRKIDDATTTHREAMISIQGALDLLEHDESALALQRQWQDYMVTRIKQWQFHQADKAEYIRRWLALGEEYHGAISDDAGALVVFEQLTASLETPITDVTPTLLKQDYLQYVAAKNSLADVIDDIAAFEAAYGLETATRFANHRRLMITEDNFEDHSSFFQAFSHLSKASQQTPDKLIRALKPLKDVYNSYPEAAVKKYLSWANNLLANDGEHHQLAVLLVEAAARFAPNHPKVIKMSKELGLELKAMPTENDPATPVT